LEQFRAWAERPVATKGNEPELAAPLRAGTISEYEAKDVLESCGLPMPRRRLVHSFAEARDAAGAIGFPVALKLQSQDLTHKSNVGGVILGIADQDELAARWAEMEAVAARHLAGLSNEGSLIERMAARGLELILGARNDPDWGTLISVGLGGVEAEALADVIFLAPDLTGSQIVASLRSLRGAALLDTFRGRPARDVGAVADAVIKVGAFMRAHPEVGELDINPLVVLAAGEGVVALDALMIVRSNAADEPSPVNPGEFSPEAVQ
jgi:acyl-CoA synthetase (NDP forming)